MRSEARAATAFGSTSWPPTPRQAAPARRQLAAVGQRTGDLDELLAVRRPHDGDDAAFQHAAQVGFLAHGKTLLGPVRLLWGRGAMVDRAGRGFGVRIRQPPRRLPSGPMAKGI